MPVSKAQQKATAKYKKENYGKIQLLISPKEKKEKIKAHAAEHNESLNAFINRSIDNQIERDTDTPPAQPTPTPPD